MTLPADGKHLSVGAIEPHFYQIMLDKLDLADNPDFASQLDSEKWPVQKEKLAELFKTQARDHWAELFEGTDACVWPVLSGEEARQHPHLKAREIFIERDGVVQPAPATRFGTTPGSVNHMMGEKEDKPVDILKNWGISETECSDLKAFGIVS